MLTRISLESDAATFRPRTLPSRFPVESQRSMSVLIWIIRCSTSLAQIPNQVIETHLRARLERVKELLLLDILSRGELLEATLHLNRPQYWSSGV